MKTTPVGKQNFGASEYRIGSAFLLAAGVHVALLGVNFSSPIKVPAKSAPIEVILVQEQSASKPKSADYLAQANLEGASFRHEEQRPATPLVAPKPDREAHLAAPPAPEDNTEGSGQTESEANGASQAPTQEAVAAAAPPAATPEITAFATQANQPRSRADSQEPKPVHEHRAAQATHSAVAEKTAEPNAARLISTSFAMASLSAEIDQRLESRSKRLRQKFVSASTQEYRYASYMEAWRAKVERIGNLNYPEEARQQHLSGNLLLDVALNPDGSVQEIVIRRPSGHKELDDAAIRIVQLSAPFAPFPEDIRREVDVLHITRSWQFLHNYQFASKS